MLYKFLDDSNMSSFQQMKWSIPTKLPGGAWKPGRWMKADGPLELCRNGLHLSTPLGFGSWGTRNMYVAEVSGLIASDLYDVSKVAANKVRLVKKVEVWNARTLGLAAIAVVNSIADEYRELQYARTGHDDVLLKQTIKSVRSYVVERRSFYFAKSKLSEFRSYQNSEWNTRLWRLHDSIHTLFSYVIELRNGYSSYRHPITLSTRLMEKAQRYDHLHSYQRTVEVGMFLERAAQKETVRLRKRGMIIDNLQPNNPFS